MALHRWDGPGWRASGQAALVAVATASTVGAGIPDGPRAHQVALLVLAVAAALALQAVAPSPASASQKSLRW